MRTMEIYERRWMSPNVRRNSRWNRRPVFEEKETLAGKVKNAISKLKLFAISLLVAFFAITIVNESARTWLNHSVGQSAAAESFSTSRNAAVPTGVYQPEIFQRSAAQDVQLIREANRYRTNMARENNRFMNNALNYAGRMVSRFSR